MDNQPKTRTLEELKTVRQEALKNGVSWSISADEAIIVLKDDAVLRDAVLRRADLRRADLRDADLRRADLSGADLRRADLRDADLRRADLSDADLSDADLRRADLSDAKGLVSPIDYMHDNFQCTEAGFIVYKTFGHHYPPPETWSIEPGAILNEVANFDRGTICGCGINVATLTWCQVNHRLNDTEVWKCLIRWEWLMGVCVPYNTDGKIRCERVELIEIAGKDEAPDADNPAGVA